MVDGEVRESDSSDGGYPGGEEATETGGIASELFEPLQAGELRALEHLQDEAAIMELMSYREYQLTFREPTPEKYIEFLKGIIAATYGIEEKFFLVKEQRFASQEEAKQIEIYLKGKKIEA